MATRRQVDRLEPSSVDAANAPAPYGGSILDAMDAAGLVGPSWDAWRTFWKAVFALPMDAQDVQRFRAQTEREAPPVEPVQEVWMPVGRRGGKSRNAALAAVYLATSFDASRLAPGEAGIVPVIAADRRQARQVLGYVRGLCETEPFRQHVAEDLKESITLKSGVAIEIHTASFRAVRGYTVIGVVCDEISFWRGADDSGANPDSEILAAIRPGTATVAGSLLIGMSSPYAARGELFKSVEKHFGRDDPGVLAWNADSMTMNPTLPRAVLERAFEDDPVSAASEYGRDGRVVFRRDVEAFLDPEAIRAVTVPERRELPPVDGVAYVAFTDPSGGSQDSFTVAIAHAEGDEAILDAVRERRPPFSPDDVVGEFADLLRRYGCAVVVGDRYAGEWPRERFREHGIEYEPSALTKSELYREVLPSVNAARVALLDQPVLRAQLVGLERRVARGGKDSVDHAPGGRDDVANAAAGALVLAAATGAAADGYFEEIEDGLVFGFGESDFIEDDNLGGGWTLVR